MPSALLRAGKNDRSYRQARAIGAHRPDDLVAKECCSRFFQKRDWLPRWRCAEDLGADSPRSRVCRKLDRKLSNMSVR